MKLRLVSASRRPDWPAWACIIVLFWCGLVTLSTWLSIRTGREAELCLFKRVTHIPCPTCGGTRACLHLIDGSISQAFLSNPLLFMTGCAVGAVLGLRFLFARAVSVSLSPRERIAAWCLAALLVALNWIYVIVYVG